MDDSASPFKIPFTIGVVGHRDLVADELPAIRAALIAALTGLRDSCGDVPLQVVTSMAEGADLLGAEVADSLGIPVVALLPYAVAQCREDLHTSAARDVFDRVMTKAERLELPVDGAIGSAAAPLPREARDRQFQRAGIVIARYSALLIAIWDGKQTEHIAGTARVIDFRRCGVARSDDADGMSRDVLLAAGDNDWMYEIRCSRARAPTAQSAVEVIGFVSGAARQPAMPKALAAWLANTAEFNRDVAANAGEIATHGRRLTPASAADAPATLLYLDRLYAAADFLGVRFRAAYTRALRMRYGLWALLAFLLLAFKKQNEGPLGLAIILGTLAIFGCGALLALVAHRRQWQRKYLDYRALAEGLRVDFYWQVSGVHKEFDGEFAHESFLQKQDVHLEWIRDAMRSVSLRLAMRTGPVQASGFAQAMRDWIGGAAGGEYSGQLHYYQHRSRALTNRLHSIERINRALLAIGLALALAFAVDITLGLTSRYLLPPQFRSGLLWAFAILTVYVAIFEIYIAEKADRALVRQYRYMCSLFEFAAEELRAASSDGDKLRVLRSLGHACLAEHAQWILAHRDKRIEGLRW
jgi:hypothetical protein